MINIDNAKEEFIRYRNLFDKDNANICLLYTSPSPRDRG